MAISVQWLAVGVVGSTSLVAAVAALPAPPPLPARAPVVAPAPAEASAAPACADEVWPRVSPACAGAAVAARSVRYVSLGPAEAMPAASAARPATARVAAPSLPVQAPVAAVRRTETRTAKRHSGAGKVREARRAPIVRVSLAPVHAAAPQPTYTVGPRPDR